MDHEHLRAFGAFAHHLSFTQAARELHLSQPALFVQVKKLEAALGLTLYERSGRVLSLTAAGARLLTHARASREADELLLAEIRGEALQSPLVLASGEGALLHLVGRALEPRKARLRVLVRDRAGTLAAVRSGEAHVGVTVSAESDGELRSEPLREVAPHVLLPRAHRLAKKRALRLDDLASVDLILPPRGAPFRVAIDHAFAALGHAPLVSLEAPGWEALRHGVKWGHGVAVVNGLCPPLPGTVARPLLGLPSSLYVLVTRRAGAARDDLQELLVRIRRAGRRHRA